MMTCSICAAVLPDAYHCYHAHPDFCHWCWEQSMTPEVGWYPHDPPAETPQPVVLSPRDVQALTRYAQHVLRLQGRESS